MLAAEIQIRGHSFTAMVQPVWFVVVPTVCCCCRWLFSEGCPSKSHGLLGWKGGGGEVLRDNLLCHWCTICESIALSFLSFDLLP